VRSDLTTAFIAAKDKTARRPRQLLVFYFAEETVYISDQEIDLGGVTYQRLVESWGMLDTAGDSEQDTGEIRQMSVTLWNGGDSRFSDRFLYESPENVEVDLYQWFVGTADSDKALIDRFVIRDPIHYGEASALLTLDLVSISMRYDGPVGDLLSADDYPYAAESDINRGIPLIVGSPGQVATLVGKTAPEAVMSGSILLLPTIVNVQGDLDDLGFPASGKIQIDTEIMEYSGRDADTFTVSVRGTDGTTAAEHSDGAAVVQHITDHTYIVGQECSAIDDVRVGGVPAVSGTYSVQPTANPATITFSEKPTYTGYSRGARETSLDFDAATAANGAFQPHYAYLEDKKSSGALLSVNYTPLAVIQTDAAVDDGEVVRAFLQVEHWATAQYLHDSVEVWVDGIGVVGTLVKPNEADTVDFSAEVDIDHGHTHQTGGDHTHDSVDPSFLSNTDDHLHDLNGSESAVVGTIDTSTQEMDAGSWGDTLYLPYGPYNANTTRAFVQFKVVSYTCYQSDGPWVEIGGERIVAGDTSTHGAWITSKTSVRLDAGGGYCTSVTPLIRVQIVDITIYVSASVTSETPIPITTQKTASGSVDGLQQTTNTIKAATDVDDLSTTNRQLENIVTASSSRSVVQRFDLTKYLETIDWAFFQNREVQLRYTGTADSAKIIVTYINFLVEYRQREINFSDDVTCSPTGAIGNRPDEVITHLLTTTAGLDASRLDTAAAAVRLTALGYSLNGVIPAEISVRTAIKNICYQSRCRLIWSGGNAKLIVREKSDSWGSVKSILPQDLQIKSVKVRRQPVAEIVNDVNVFFKKDHTQTGDDKNLYAMSANAADTDSISKNGLRRNDAGFLFDLVTDQAMAESLADFYMWLKGSPSTFYEFACYLSQFDLEKEDVVTVTSRNFTDLIRRRLVIRSADRIFGSAKNSVINLYKILAESIRQRTILVSAEDTMTILDALSIEEHDGVISEDQTAFADVLVSQVVAVDADTATLADVLVNTIVMVLETAETATLGDSLVAEMVVVLDDSFSMSDEVLDTYDVSAFADELLTDSGFGSPLGDGFGLVPFGSPK